MSTILRNVVPKTVSARASMSAGQSGPPRAVWCPVTIRADADLAETLERMTSKKVASLIVSTPVTAQSGPTSTGMTADDVERALRTWPSLYLDDQDRVVGF